MPKKAGEETQDEIADDVFGSERERASPETPNDMGGGQGAPPAGEGGGEAPAGDPAEQGSRMVPLGELTSERKKFQDQIGGLNSTIGELKLQLAELTGRVAARSAPQRRPAPPPDPRTDPEAALAYTYEAATRQATARFLNFSEARAVRDHGKETVKAAKDAARAAGVFYDFADRSDPYGDLVDWHKDQTARAKIADPKKWADEERKKIREEVLAELSGQTPEQKAAAAANPKFPGTLGARSASGVQGASPPTQAAVANELFASTRKRG